MCGILGVLDFGKNRVLGKKKFSSMLDIMSHRGPDEGVVWQGKNLMLGMRRLKIIDLRKGLYPITNERGTISLVFNGEIYNFRALREELEGKGHRFKTDTDAEVIVHAYEEFGIDCLKKFRGMFAIALWDSEKQQLFLAKDRAGKKPLYFSCQKDFFIFASELKSILPFDQMPKELDWDAISLYTRFGYVPAPFTPFKGIRKLEAGHYLLVDRKSGRVIDEQYWDLVYDPGRASEHFYIQKLLRLLEESVRLRLESDVPLGVFLSGGLDSSMVAALASNLIYEATGNRLKTFSVGFSEEKYDELSDASLVAEHIASTHTELKVTPEAEKVLDTLAWHYGEPYADASSIPTYYLSKVTREHVTVALNGDGGDENFAGYRRYVQHMKSRHVKLPGFAVCMVKPFVSGHKERAVELLAKDDYGRFTSMQTYLEEKPLYQSEVNNADYLLPHFNKQRHLLNKLLYTDIKSFLPDDLLVKVDVATMANSLEGRSPLLDHKLMQFCATIPPRMKLQGSRTKIIFKKAAVKFLPKDILTKPKQGFAVPINEWLRGELKHLINAEIFEKGTFFRKHSKVFNLDYVEKLVEQHARGIDNGYRLWNLIMLNKWRKAYKEYL